MTKPQGIVSFVLALLAVLNFALSGMGLSPIPVDADAVNMFVTLCFALIGVVGTAWNNFNVTDAAKVGDALIDNIKNGSIDVAEADRLVRDLIEAGKGLND